MRSYELRLLDSCGKATVYRFQCLDDDKARRRILPVLSGDDEYQRFELWQGMDLLASGARIIVAQLECLEITDLELVT